LTYFGFHLHACTHRQQHTAEAAALEEASERATEKEFLLRIPCERISDPVISEEKIDNEWGN
jgi:hypothetical protein